MNIRDIVVVVAVVIVIRAAECNFSCTLYFMKVLIFEPCFGFHHSFPEVKCIIGISQNQSVLLSICFPQSFPLKIFLSAQTVPRIAHIRIKILLLYLLVDVFFKSSTSGRVQKMTNSSLVTF